MSTEARESDAACPRGGLCLREQEWGHPCDRDAHGDSLAACEKTGPFNEGEFGAGFGDEQGDLG